MQTVLKCSTYNNFTKHFYDFSIFELDLVCRLNRASSRRPKGTSQPLTGVYDSLGEFKQRVKTLPNYVCPTTIITSEYLIAI